MSTESAAILTMSVNFLTLIVIAVFFVVPWARRVPLRAALVPLVIVHTGRTVALQLFSAQESGYAISDAARDQIVWGDLVGAGLAILTLILLAVRSRAAIVAAWILVVATVVDLSNALRVGLDEELLGRATDMSWMILTFYVPMLWVSIGLIAWLLATRGSDSLQPTETV